MPLPSKSAVRVLGAFFSLALLAAACGDDDDEATTGTTAAAPGASDETTTTVPEDDEMMEEYTVDVGDTDLGQILVSEGRTLYTFMPDNGGAPTCYDSCAATWPPLLVDGDVSVEEPLDAALFGTVARDDGGQQVTVDGWPLYYFANDSAPGDHNGQGIGGVWFVVSPDGTQITS